MNPVQFSSHCHADRLVDLVDGYMTLDDDEQAAIRQFAADVIEEIVDEETPHERRQRRRNELHAKRKRRPKKLKARSCVYSPYPSGPWELPFEVLVAAFQSPNKHPGRKA